MATRKIRVTLSGTQVSDQGPIIDIDFNGVNLDADVDVNAVYGTSTLVKEYTVDVNPGTYNLDIQFKNDSNASENSDRNLYIEKIEFANNGVDYESLVITELNSNFKLWDDFKLMGWVLVPNDSYNPDLPVSIENSMSLINSAYDQSQPRTDGEGYILGENPGSNPKHQYNFEINPAIIWTAGTKFVNITFS